MADWQPGLYLEFDKERTQPSIDLVARIDIDDPLRIIDIGCGPGNSTRVLSLRWLDAEVVGLDNSASMIETAKATYPETQWICADACGDLTNLGRFDIVFSNAAIQWMPNQETLLPNLFGLLNPGGVLAVQVPCTEFMPIHIELEALAASDKWKGRFTHLDTGYSTHRPGFYYDIVSALSPRVDLWETRYFHIMGSPADIVKWYSASGLRPYLDALDDALKADFTADYERAITSDYPKQADGRLLFPFTRIFFIATRV